MKSATFSVILENVRVGQAAPFADVSCLCFLGGPGKNTHCFITLCEYNRIIFIEVRDSRTGYLVPGRDGPGVWPDGRVVGASPPSPSASPGN